MEAASSLDEEYDELDGPTGESSSHHSIDLANGLVGTNGEQLNGHINDLMVSDSNLSEDGGVRSDQELMPPPPAPVTSAAGDSGTDGGQPKQLPAMPLAAMRPSKYADVDVREIFPDFRVDKVS